MYFSSCDRSLLIAASMLFSLVGCADLSDRGDDERDSAPVQQADQGSGPSVEYDAQWPSLDSGPDAGLDAGSTQRDADASAGEEGPDGGATLDSCFLGGLAEGWESTFVGPNREGSAAGSIDSSTICLRAGGEDIIGRADDFLFVHQRREGDVTLTAHLTHF